MVCSWFWNLEIKMASGSVLSGGGNTVIIIQLTLSCEISKSWDFKKQGQDGSGDDKRLKGWIKKVHFMSHHYGLKELKTLWEVPTFPMLSATMNVWISYNPTYSAKFVLGGKTYQTQHNIFLTALLGENLMRIATHKRKQLS